MVHIVWRFRAKHDRLADFHRAYSPDGDWAQLFRISPEYRGTTLLQDATDPCSFLLTDTWTSEQAFAQFRIDYAAEYESLDRACEALTEQEVKIGMFVEC